MSEKKEDAESQGGKVRASVLRWTQSQTPASMALDGAHQKGRGATNGRIKCPFQSSIQATGDPKNKVLGTRHSVCKWLN